MNQKALFLILYSISILQSCAQPTANNHSGVKFEFLDVYVVPFNKLVDSTVVGGLSGIDWHHDNLFTAISDDRSEYDFARAYPLKIHQSNDKIDHVEFFSPFFLKKPDGTLFELDEVDPEAIRYHKASQTYFYSSEGGREEHLQYPFVWEMDVDGNYLRQLDIPILFNFNENSGTRTNGGFESLTIENDTIVWYANELPLKQDGIVPTFEQGYFPIRLIRHDIKNDVVLNQFTYNIEAVSARPSKAGGFYNNSVTEILYINSGELWILERAYVSGVGNFIKLFSVSTENAVDVKSASSLMDLESTQLKKELILDFSDFDHRPDNIEGITFGPELPDGRKSVYFIADNNFNDKQKTQIWLFAVSGLAAIQ